MRQGRVIAQLAILIAWDVVDFADGGEHLGLFNSVNAQIRFEIQVQIEHLLGIAGFFHHQR